MKKQAIIKCVACILGGIFYANVNAQQPNLSSFHNKDEKIRKWISYCESFRMNSNGNKNNYALMEDAALRGVEMAGKDDVYDRSRFFFYAGIATYTQVKFDSAQYYFYLSLYEGQKANAAELIAPACVALIPVNFQLRQPDKVDSCKNILHAILDTTKNVKILEDGYSAMGNYYQEKSYYSTAQNYLLKGIALRKKQIDTTTDAKLKADYAIQCYLLSKQYENTDVLDKSLAILKEGRQYASASPLVSIRFLSSFTEVYSLMGNIDSALVYEEKLEAVTKNSPTVPSEMVSANLNIAAYYLDRNQPQKAFPYINKADTLSSKSKSPILIYQSQMISGRYFDQMGESKKAISLLTQSLPVAMQINKGQYADILKFIAVAQRNSGNMKESVKAYERYVSVSDSLTKEKISRNFADLETRYQTAEKENQIVSLDQKNKLNTLELKQAANTKTMLILGLVSLGIISLLLYFIYRNKEKNNRVLNRQNKQLDDLNHQLYVANDTKAKLFGVISHDLRSPVSKIVQLLHLQKENSTNLSDEIRSQYNERVNKASENVLETMEDLLLWSKSQMQNFIPRIEPVKIKPLLVKESQLFEEQLLGKGLQIDVSCEDSLIQNTDENFVSVIIRNLLQNAINQSPSQETILLAANNQSLSVINTVANADVEVIKLNNLIQNSNITSAHSGLGMQIVKDLATRINMKIYFEKHESNKVAAVLTHT